MAVILRIWNSLLHKIRLIHLQANRSFIVKNADGFIIYSVGDDQIDDGGHWDYLSAAGFKRHCLEVTPDRPSRKENRIFLHVISKIMIPLLPICPPLLKIIKKKISGASIEAGYQNSCSDYFFPVYYIVPLGLVFLMTIVPKA